MATPSVQLWIPPDAVCNYDEDRVRGRLTVECQSASWVVPRLVPARLQAEICFPSTDGRTRAPLHLCAGQVLHVPIVSTPAEFCRYLNDVQSAEIHVKDLDKFANETFASGILFLDGLVANSSKAVSLPVHSGTGRCVGHIELMVQASFHSLLSDCGMNSAEIVAFGACGAELTATTNAMGEDILDQIEDEAHKATGTIQRKTLHIGQIFPVATAAASRRPWQAIGAFRQLDQNRSGKIDSEDSVRLICQILPCQLSPSQEYYLRFMLDASGLKEFKFQDLLSEIQDCQDTVLSSASPGTQAWSLLSNAAFDLQQRSLDLGKMFRQQSMLEKLQLGDVISIMAELVCKWDRRVQRLLLVQMYQMFPDLTDEISLTEVKHVCRAIIMLQSQPRNQARTKYGLERRHRMSHAQDGGSIEGLRLNEDTCEGQNEVAGRLQIHSCRDRCGYTTVDGTPSHGAEAIAQSRLTAARHCIRSQQRTTDTFETQYNEICSLLATCRLPTPGSRNFHRHTSVARAQASDAAQVTDGTPEKPEGGSTRQLPVGEDAVYRIRREDLVSAQVKTGDHESTSRDKAIALLMTRALYLKHLLAELSASVLTEGMIYSLRDGKVDQEGRSSGSPATERVQDVADLAALRALTAFACPAVCSESVQYDSQEPMACTESGTENAVKPAEAGQAQASHQHVPLHHDGTGSHASDASDQAHTHRAHTHSSSHRRGGVDVKVHLSVSRVSDLVLSESAKLLMQHARAPGLWLAWRVPGSDGVRPWLQLMNFQRALQCRHSTEEVNSAASCEVFLSLSSLRAIQALGHALTIQCELWLVDGANPNIALKDCQTVLMGILSVPLRLRVSELDTAVLANGVHRFRNVLEGFEGAKIELCITAPAEHAALLKDVLPGLPVAGSALVGIHHDVMVAAHDPHVTSFHGQAKAETHAAASNLMINHEFKVHIISIQQLPGSSRNKSWPPTVARYLKYMFPCDDQALYTQDIPVQVAHKFEDATFALHRIGLPKGALILEHLVQESTVDAQDSACLNFEVYDCFDEDTGVEDFVCFKGQLPVRDILGSADVDAADHAQVARCVEAHSNSADILTSNNRFVVTLSASGGRYDCFDSNPPLVTVDVQYTCEAFRSD
eukprot:jgi/Ulvmu1/10616/UM065_0073.1